jgi:hypothetical protein
MSAAEPFHYEDTCRRGGTVARSHQGISCVIKQLHARISVAGQKLPVLSAAENVH